VARAVVVEIVVELVCDRGELLEEVVDILFTARPTGFRDDLLEALCAGIEELDEDGDAIARDIGSLAELLDLGV